MPIHDEALYLAEALDSLFAQTYQDFEIICIDDGSTDGTASVLAAYQRRDSRLVVCHQPSSGIVHALNRGCGLARGRYVARMDGDDIALPDRLERQVAAWTVWTKAVAAARRSPGRRRLQAKVLLARARLHRE